MQPLRDDIRVMTNEISSLRSELATIGQRSGEVGSQALHLVQDRFETLAVRVSGIIAEMETLVSQPGQLVDYAIDQTADVLKSTIYNDWQCSSGRIGDSDNTRG